MVKGGVIGFGVFLIIVAVIGNVSLLEDHTVTQASKLCESGMGQFGQMLNNDIRENCSDIDSLLSLIIVFVILGFILIVIGGVA